MKMNARSRHVELQKRSEYKVCLSSLAFFEKYTTVNVPKFCMLTFWGNTLIKVQICGGSKFVHLSASAVESRIFH
jgi:hypothetical protein